MSASAFAAILGLTAAADPQPDAAGSYAGAFDGAPVLTWSAPLPGPKVAAATHTELGAPVLHDRRIFVGSAADDALLVLSRDDGRLLARLPARGPVQAPPVIVGERIWFSDTAGDTSCYSLDDYRQVWQHEGTSPVLSQPLVDAGRVYVSNIDDVVVALDAATGEFRWRHAQKVDRVDSGPSLYGAPAPTMLHGDAPLLITGYSDGTLVALTPDTGEISWQRRVGEGAWPDLIGAAVDDGTSLLAGGFSGPLLALEPRTRTVRWRVETGSATAPTLGPADPASGLPQVFHGGVDGVLRAIDARTGAVRWEWDSATQGALTPPVYTDAGLLIGSSSGALYLVDPATGHETWELDTGYLLAGISAAPVVDGRQAIVLTNAGNVLSLVVPTAPGAGDRGDGDFIRVGGPDRPDPSAGAPDGG